MVAFRFDGRSGLVGIYGEYDSQRLYYGVNRFIDEWYKGDAWYGDGAELHLDYYNSLVIHPMLTDILYVMKKHGLERAEFLERQLVRQQRMAAQLERMISPEATYPVVGRSIVYRLALFMRFLKLLCWTRFLSLFPKDRSVLL